MTNPLLVHILALVPTGVVRSRLVSPPLIEEGAIS
jgi:hypothetical protein